MGQKNQVLVGITDVNNQVDVRSVYPEAAGPTLGIRGSALTPFTSGGYKDVPVIAPSSISDILSQ